ncbi:MAG: thiamine ABC transporter substrate-binding protein [Candidatus Heimdallarchaeota archaeon]|nr:thiamine ABC transporter substrate-binding protein [Candidatus Heimdallarchaeota archaeon]
MRTRVFATIFVVLILPYFGINGAVKIQNGAELTIYTYESLLADPGFDYAEAFATYANLDSGSINVVLLADAGSIVTRAAVEKSDPVADILIGIDNVLVSQARELNILTPYVANGINNLEPGLVDSLASDYLLTPYDYGVISLWFLQDSLNGTIDPASFDLNVLMTDEFSSQLIVQNPALSSPGLGFLLSSIALYGDDSGVDGLIEGDWEDYWRALSVHTRLTSSWGEAIDLLYTDESRSMMVSYSTSPAYGACLFDDTTTTSILPSIDGNLYGWQQVEGIGLVRNADHTDLAKEFIDWFISEELQSEIHLNNWVYPAHKDIEEPECYSAAIPHSSITPLNQQITSEQLSNNLENWLDTWEIVWAEGPENEDNLIQDIVPVSHLFFMGLLVLVPLRRRKH